MVVVSNDAVTPGYDLAPGASVALLASSFYSSMTSSRFSSFLERVSYEFLESSEYSELSKSSGISFVFSFS